MHPAACKSVAQDRRLCRQPARRPRGLLPLPCFLALVQTARNLLEGVLNMKIPIANSMTAQTTYVHPFHYNVTIGLKDRPDAQVGGRRQHAAVPLH